MTTYLDDGAAFPYCPGCGHPHVLRALDEALATTGLPPRGFVLTTDIGCVGLADALFPTLHTVHALHGRAAALAAGMELAGRQRGGPPLKPVVLVGDGGATIGLLHLVHAAQLDVDVTVLVHDNLVYGMTGGQHSGLTPQGFRTTTTPAGNPVPPLDLGQVLAGAGVSFFARTRAPGHDLVETIADALRHPGFACVEILELCPTFAARVGGMTGKGLDAMIEARGLPLGRIVDRPRPQPPAPAPLDDADPLAAALPRLPRTANLPARVQVIVAGRAGERAQSAAKLAATAGAVAGLHVAVRTDNPVTQGKGFSLAEITLSPAPITTTVVERADLVVATAAEGVAELRRAGWWRSDAPVARWVVDASLECPPGAAAVDRPDLRGRHGAKRAALGALIEAVDRAGWWPREAWRAATATLPPGPRADAEALLDRVAAPANPSA